MSNPITPQKVGPAGSGSKIGNIRWIICGLLFFATTINYLDRQVISYLKEFFCKPLEAGGFGWTNKDYSTLTSCFTGFYAGMTVLAGWVIDRIGTRLGLAISMTIWSVFGMLNAFVGGALGMHILIRSAFGIGEAGNFPASIKTVAEWFPKRERALATGIFNSGSNCGAMVAALLIPWCMLYFGDQAGWKMAFLITGAFGFVWLGFWFWLYQSPMRHEWLKRPEYEYIHSDDDEQKLVGSDGDKSKVTWGRLLKYRQTWAFFMGKFLTDGVWWFYLFWLPDYLKKQFGMTKQEIMLPTFIVYGVAIVGSVYGSCIPLTFMKRGMPVFQARVTSMLLIALLPLTVLFTQFFGNVARFGATWAPILAVAVICIGAAAHQAWSANLFTTVSDLFPKKSVGSVTGIGTMAGGIGGVIVQLLAGGLGDLFQRTPQTAYLIMFIICALSYLSAWGVMKMLVPHYKPITDL